LPLGLVRYDGTSVNGAQAAVEDAEGAASHGLCVRVTNPKALILFGSAPPQFVNPGQRGRDAADAPAQPGVGHRIEVQFGDLWVRRR
jgi:threonine/homoserine/homoserine lactone efflux protein